MLNAPWGTRARSSGPTPRGTRSQAAPRSAPAARTATPSGSLAASKRWGTPAIRTGSTSPSIQVTLPLRWRGPRRIFVNSMSDLFHHDVPETFIRRTFEVMVEARWHIFQVLTKRAQRLAELAPRLPWPSNVWQGVSVENARYTFRVADLVKVPAAVRFLSVEPLLGPIPRLPLKGIDWVIVGGESGPGHRPVKLEWIRDIRGQCAASEVPFFFKQWGGPRPTSGGRILDGRLWNEMPASDSKRATTTSARLR